MTLESTVGVAKAGTNSLRATLPQGIVSYLNLKPGATDIMARLASKLQFLPSVTSVIMFSIFFLQLKEINLSCATLRIGPNFDIYLAKDNCTLSIFEFIE
jgi:hypothetical protein